MPYIIDPTTKAIEETQMTTFQRLGLKERQDLEQWVINEPSILGESLLIITSEYQGFDQTQERLDVLALDKQGKLVVVELKTDDSGSSAELQAIKYAAYCSNLTLSDVIEIYAGFWSRRDDNATTEEQAEETIRSFIEDEGFKDFDSHPRIILAAGKFRSEVTATVLWLRSFDLDISCVKLELLEMGEKVILLPSVIIPLPDAREYEIRREKKDVEVARTSSRGRLDQQFFDELLTHFRDITQQKALPRSWLALPSGKTNVQFAWNFNGRPRCRFSSSSRCGMTASIPFWRNQRRMRGAL
ncbi:MAG: DUF91 domain-containing protein [Chloroflexi bacterium]|nr:DUF91 domain-containing protein [Chloroflexota bacterium]